jgi:hypothetical protein
VGKHLLDETAEFRLPTLGRHAAGDHAEDQDELETTQRIDGGFQRPRTVPGAQRDDDAGAR